MNTTELIKVLAEKLNKTQAEVKKLLKETTDSFQIALGETKKFSIPGLGTFGTRKQEGSKGYNPVLKKYLELSPKEKVTYKPAKILKEKVKDRKV